MSLGDRYNRGGGRMANLDRSLTHVGAQLGRAWFDHTGTSQQLLCQSLYIVASWTAVQHLTLFRNPTVLIFAGVGLLALQGKTQSRGGLVEQIQSEAMGLPKWWFALCRMIVLGLGLFNLAVGCGQVLVALQLRSPLPLAAVGTLLMGCTMTALQAGDYIGRSNPLTPSGGHRRHV